MILVQYFSQKVQADGPESTNQKLNRKMAILNQTQLINNKAQHMKFDTLQPMQQSVRIKKDRLSDMRADHVKSITQIQQKKLLQSVDVDTFPVN